MLTIAVIGYNLSLSIKAAQFLGEIDEDASIKRKDRHYVEMSDGTHYVPLYTEESTRGYRFDQVFIVDDERWMVYKKQWKLIDSVVGTRMSRLFKGSAWQVQKVAW